MDSVAWDASLHPRDRGGRFIEVLNLVAVLALTSDDQIGVGRAVGARLGADGQPQVAVGSADGKSVWYPSKQVRVIQKKATLSLDRIRYANLRLKDLRPPDTNYVPDQENLAVNLLYPSQVVEWKKRVAYAWANDRHAVYLNDYGITNYDFPVLDRDIVFRNSNGDLVIRRRKTWVFFGNDGATPRRADFRREVDYLRENGWQLVKPAMRDPLPPDQWYLAGDPNPPIGTNFRLWPVDLRKKVGTTLEDSGTPDPSIARYVEWAKNAKITPSQLIYGKWIDPEIKLSVKEPFPSTSATKPDDTKVLTETTAFDWVTQGYMDSASDIKRGVQDALYERLKDKISPEDVKAEWDRRAADSGATDDDGFLKGLIRNMVSAWSETSNDHSVLSLALQEEAEEMFGLRNVYPWDDESDDLVSAIADYRYASGSKILQPFLQAMYDNTQEELRKTGATYVELYRGYRPESQVPNGKAQVRLRPLSSFSASEHTTHMFGDVEIKSYVPVERIIGTARTGFGCRDEAEFVIFGGDIECLLHHSEELS